MRVSNSQKPYSTGLLKPVTALRHLRLSACICMDAAPCVFTNEEVSTLFQVSTFIYERGSVLVVCTCLSLSISMTVLLCQLRVATCGWISVCSKVCRGVSMPGNDGFYCPQTNSFKCCLIVSCHSLLLCILLCLFFFFLFCFEVPLY